MAQDVFEYDTVCVQTDVTEQSMMQGQACANNSQAAKEASIPNVPADQAIQVPNKPAI